MRKEHRYKSEQHGLWSTKLFSQPSHVGLVHETLWRQIFSEVTSGGQIDQQLWYSERTELL